MIASFGGLTIDKKGNRDYPGSGGMVGGLSEPGKNYSYILGGGARYNSFTPSPINNIPPIEIDPCNQTNCQPPDDCPCGNCLVGCIDPPPIDPPPIDPPPIDPPPIDPPPMGVCPGDPGCPPEDETITGGIAGIIQRLLGATPLNNSGPVYLFTPQPGEAASGGVDMKNLAIIVGIGLVAWFAYQKLS